MSEQTPLRACGSRDGPGSGGAVAGMLPSDAERPIDEEYSQALARIVLSTVALAICLGIWFAVPGRGWSVVVATMAVAGYCLLALAWAAIVKRYPGHFVARRATVIATDLGMVAFGIYMMGELGASFYPLYLWIIVGNGMRYGPRYLCGAMGTAGLAQAIVLFASDYWRHELPMGLGLWFGLFVLPLFYLTLIRRLHASNGLLARALVASKAATEAQAALAHENARLLGASETAATALRDKNAELDSFVYTASHDLKAPLVTIEGMATLVLEEHADGLDPDVRHYVERIQINARHMERLLLDLLALSRIGREACAPEPIKLADVVDDVRAELGEAIRARGVTLTVGDLPTICAIRVQIEQVVRNLLTNALKYMGDPPSPTIEIGAVDRGDVVECWVRDTGIGIDAIDHERIFDMFQRVNAIDAEGSGLGLPIVKKIVEAAGGRLWVESATGQGSTFRFTWPAGPVPSTAIPSTHVVEPDLASLPLAACATR